MVKTESTARRKAEIARKVEGAETPRLPEGRAGVAPLNAGLHTLEGVDKPKPKIRAVGTRRALTSREG